MNPCPDCDGIASVPVSRRQFVQTASAAAVAAVAAPALLRAADSGVRKSEPLVKKLHESLTPAQKEEICFPWDYADDRGLLRMHVSNNWQITDKKFSSGFFTKDQQD
ncbi:MAG: twin-arginine translocation signal domain-containing protein, partial [Planctomycetaceae bacterium]|nr:twin-arginine translocation signal domain-containing protein [Planctomycetaceae bacterium]